MPLCARSVRTSTDTRHILGQQRFRCMAPASACSIRLHLALIKVQQDTAGPFPRLFDLLSCSSFEVGLVHFCAAYTTATNVHNKQSSFKSTSSRLLLLPAACPCLSLLGKTCSKDVPTTAHGSTQLLEQPARSTLRVAKLPQRASHERCFRHCHSANSLNGQTLGQTLVNLQSIELFC